MKRHSHSCFALAFVSVRLSVYYSRENDDQLSWKKRLIILQLFRVVRNEPHSVIAGAASSDSI